MCDTFVVMPDVTRDGSIIFGKNSDREPNEAQTIELIPAMDHSTGSRVRCTYIDIPQVEHTYSTLLSKPYWMWGAEMGANEKGVVIGNEAVFTRLPAARVPALLGMDMIRLGLERAATAHEALHVIINLLETHGQGGNCSSTTSLYYNNSFIIADASEAWVLETVGKEWAAVKVKRGVRSISNAITISNEWDLCSNDLVSTAIKKGWCKKAEDFNFGRHYSDFLFTTFSDAHSRQRCTTQLLESSNEVDIPFAMKVLRSHGLSSNDDWSPDKAIFGATVCCHEGFGPVRISQTTGSMVSRLRVGEEPVHWITGTSAPCLGLFKPVWISSGLPDLGPAPTEKYNPDSLWWKHERLHLLSLMNYQKYLNLYRSERDALESRFLQEAEAGPSLEISQDCFRAEEEAREQWYEWARQAGIKNTARFYFKNTWAGFNRSAGMPED